MTLWEKVEQQIKALALLKRRDRILVAVSGGPDSMALLHLLYRLCRVWEFELTVVHVNHMIRGSESDEEAELVKEYTASLGIAYQIVEINVPQLLQGRGGNVQDIARNARYNAMFQLADELGIRKIALAHHADDQAETYLMRMIKGASPAGMSGMVAKRKMKRHELIRPLLGIYKQQLIDYCRKHNIPYCIDSSNASTKYLRNRIRLELVPYLQQLNPKVTQALNQTVQLLQEDEQYLEAQANQWLQQNAKRSHHTFNLERVPFQKLHIALQRRVIKLILNYLSKGQPVWDFNKLERLRTSLASTETHARQFEIGKKIICSVQYDKIRFGYKEAAPVSFTYDLGELPCQLKIEATGACLKFHVLTGQDAGQELHGSSTQAYFDMEEIQLPLTIRNRQPGDRMYPLGMNGSKKVKDIFIDDKIKTLDRDMLPLIFDAKGRLLWIPTVRRSKFALVTNKSNHILHIVYQKRIP